MSIVGYIFRYFCVLIGIFKGWKGLCEIGIVKKVVECRDESVVGKLYDCFGCIWYVGEYYCMVMGYVVDRVMKNLLNDEWIKLNGIFLLGYFYVLFIVGLVFWRFID